MNNSLCQRNVIIVSINTYHNSNMLKGFCCKKVAALNVHSFNLHTRQALIFIMSNLSLDVSLYLCFMNL